MTLLYSNGGRPTLSKTLPGLHINTIDSREQDFAADKDSEGGYSSSINRLIAL